MNTTAPHTTLKSRLQQIIDKDTYKSLVSEVAREAMNTDSGSDEAIKEFFTILSEYGAYEALTFLNYTLNTHPLFEKHYMEIEWLRKEHEFVAPFSEDLKTALVCFAFEKIADEIAEELGLL